MDEEYKGTAIVVPTLDTFMHEQWEITKGITSPRFSIVKDLYPDQEFRVIVLLGKYEIANAKTNIKISAHIESPDGNRVPGNVFETILQIDMEEHMGFILLPEFPEFRFSKAENEGEYTIVVCINDLHTGEEEIVKAQVSLHKAIPSQFTERELDLEEWRQNYYLDPQPNELILYYLHSMDVIGLNNNANILFFVEALNNSMFLIEDINQLLLEGVLPQPKRNALNFLVARSNHRGDDLDGFSEAELKILHGIRDEDDADYNPLLNEEITHPSQLDILWNMFFANGKYENIEKIISTLSYIVGTSLEEAQNAPAVDIMQVAIGMASAWSLGSNAKTHDLVRTYIIYTLNRPDFPEKIKGELVSILEGVEEE